MNHQTRGYMNTVHIRENDVIYCIICTEISDDETEDSFLCIHYLQCYYADNLINIKLCDFCNNTILLLNKCFKNILCNNQCRNNNCYVPLTKYLYHINLIFKFLNYNYSIDVVVNMYMFISRFMRLNTLYKINFFI